MNVKAAYEIVVIGVSAGGLQALSSILPQVPKNFPLPILIVQHRSADADNFLATHLDGLCKLQVCDATDKQEIGPGNIYLAPPGYHMLIEEDHRVALCLSAPISFSRPSVDVLFESAAVCYREKCIAIILTGANFDGAKGLKMIDDCGGYCLVQNPESAESASMPTAALQLCPEARVLELEEIAPLLTKLA